MLYFKHYCTASDSKSINELFDEFGHKGIAFWWLLLELCSEHWDGQEDPRFEFHSRTVVTKLKSSSRSVEPWLKLCSTLGMCAFAKIGTRYQISIPKLLEVKTSRSVVKSNKNQLPVYKEEDKDKDKDKDKELTPVVKKPTVSKPSTIKPSHEIRVAYSNAYKQRYSIEPSWGAAEYTMANRVMKSLPKEEVIQLVKDYLCYNDPWHVKQKHPFKLFVTQLDKIRVELNDPRRMLDSGVAQKQLGNAVDNVDQGDRKKRLEEMKKQAEADYEQESIRLTT